VSRSRLSISNIAWERDDDDAVASLLRDAGFGGIELAPTTRWPAPLDVPPQELADFREAWEARRLRIVALQSLLYGRDDLLLFGTEAQRQALLDHLGGMAELAASLGATRLVFGSPANRRRGDLPVDDAMSIAVELFRRVGALMEKYGVQLCIEPNPPEYGCDFVTTVAQGIALVDRINRPGIALQGDLGGITLEGAASGPTIRGAGARIGHFHASEPRLAEPGTGKSDHPAAARALAEVGYLGWISIEMKKPEENRVATIARAIRYVRAIYQRVAR
jgi:D-psicose/D-tagatose/L-ribulose 3-epimerase